MFTVKNMIRISLTFTDANTFGVYPEEIAGLQRDYEKLWGRVSDVLMELSALVEK